MSSIDEAADLLARQYEGSYERREARAQAEQKAIAYGNRRSRSVKGLGELRMEVPASVAKDWQNKEHKDILRDPDFIKYQKRKNPGMFAETEKAGNRVGYTGS